MGTFKHFREIVKINLDTYWIVIIYGMAIALLSLVVPIAAQTLVNVVAFGTVLQPVIVLTVIVFVILSAVAGLRIAQAILVESIQQRVFTQTALELSKTLPRIKLSNFENYRVSELVNRFFEIQTIQKSLAMLLVTGIELVLLAIFSMLLIAFYHPLLLAFDFVLIIALLLALWIPYKGALKYSIQECEAKHTVASWLEEIIHNIMLFKVQNHSQYALTTTDDKICNYLNARKKHFSYILKHIAGMNVIYVVANAALLGIGGYLVINNQLSLGQLVASEIVVNALLYGFVRMSFYLEDLYDLFASSEKLGNLLDIPCEFDQTKSKQHVDNLEAKLKERLSIQCENIAYTTSTNKALFSNLNFDILSGEHFVILGNKGSGKSVLVDMMLGFRQTQEGVIRINNIPIQEYDLRSLRRYTSLVRKLELFSGTLYDNLVLQRNDIPIESIHELLNELGLSKTIEVLPQGLDTFISGSQMTMSTTEIKKLMFARALLTKPSLLIIDGALDSLPDGDLNLILEYLKHYQATVVITTRRIDIANYYDEFITL